MTRVRYASVRSVALIVDAQRRVGIVVRSQTVLGRGPRYPLLVHLYFSSLGVIEITICTFIHISSFSETSVIVHSIIGCFHAAGMRHVLFSPGGTLSVFWALEGGDVFQGTRTVGILTYWFLNIHAVFVSFCRVAVLT